MRKHLLALVVVAAASLASASMARDIPATGLTIPDIVSWLQAGGYQAQVITGSDGKQHVKTAANGVSFGVYLFDCKEGRCGSVQFAAGWDTKGTQDQARVGVWNRDKRWARAYIDSSNDPWLEMDCDITPGGTYELLDDEFATWRSVVTQFHDDFLTK